MISVLNTPLFFLIPLVTYWLVHKLIRARTNPISPLPGPDAGHWLWGHELMAHETPFEGAYTEWVTTYGPTYKIKGAFFHPDIVVTVDQLAISQIFGKGVYSYTKSAILRNVVDRLVGRGLIWAEGAVHKRQRQQLAPFFTNQAVRGMFHNFNACAQMGIENLESHIVENARNPRQGLGLDITEWTGSITLDIIGRFAFNYDFESGRGRPAQLINHTWRKQVKAALHWTALLGQVVSRAFPLVAYLPIPFLEAQLEVKKSLREIAQTIVDQGGNEGKEKDMLTTMVRLTSQGTVASTHDELLDHVCTMVIAGQETTSGSLSFSLHHLALNPEYQNRLREEVMQLGREPTYDDLTLGMPWLDAVTKESIRHRPIISHMERVVTEDYILKLGDPVQATNGAHITEIPIRAGQMIVVPTMTMNHMKSIWGEDADEFKPERWLDPSRLTHVNTSFGWNGMLSFSEGPRQCIGYRMAVLEFKTILATYIQKFEFHDTGAVVHGRFVGTMQPFVAGEEGKGSQLPLRVSLVNEGTI